MSTVNFSLLFIVLLLSYRQLTYAQDAEYHFNLQIFRKVSNISMVNLEWFDKSSNHFINLAKSVNFLNNIVNNSTIHETFNSEGDATYKLKEIQPIECLTEYRVLVAVTMTPRSLSSGFVRKTTPVLNNIFRSAGVIDGFNMASSNLTFTKPVTCRRESESPPKNITWPESEMGVRYSFILPVGDGVEKGSFLSKMCLNDGWARTEWMRIPFPPEVNINNKNIEFNSKNKDIHLEIVKNMTNDDVERTLFDLVAAESKNLQISNANHILWLLNAVIETRRSENISQLHRYMEAVQAVMKRQILLEDGVYTFESRNIAMIIKNISGVYGANGTRRQLTFEVHTVNDELRPCLVIYQTSAERIIIPLQNLLQTKTDAIAICAFKNGYLFGTKKIKSKVYTILIRGTNAWKQEQKEKVTMTFKYDMNKTEEDLRTLCVFRNTEFLVDYGDWSTDGCLTIFDEKEKNVVTCSCNHLSSFALLQLPAAGLGDANVRRLKRISIIGCSISAISLLLTLVTYLMFKQLRDNVPSRILIMITCNLLCTNVFYIINAFLVLTYSQATQTCKVIAVLLHYVLLSSLAWMGAGGFYMYRFIIDVFVDQSKSMFKLSLFGFGVPFLVVYTTAATDFNQNYVLANKEICWLSDAANIFSFYVPVSAIMLFNMYIFCEVNRRLSRILKNDQNSQTQMKVLRTQLKGIVSVTILLGLTWSFGLLAIGPVETVFAYLFVICNAFQGFFIFIFYCVVKKDARFYWSKHCNRICRAKSLQGTMDTTFAEVKETFSETVDIVQYDNELEDQHGSTPTETTL